jgi:hypothetical protein
MRSNTYLRSEHLFDIVYTNKCSVVLRNDVRPVVEDVFDHHPAAGERTMNGQLAAARAHGTRSQNPAAMRGPGRSGRRARRERTARRGWERYEGALLLLIAALLVAGALATSGRVPASGEFATLKVDPGTSLWTIAAEHPVEGLTTQQLAETIAELNRVAPGAVAAGQSLRVPKAVVEARVASR